MPKRGYHWEVQAWEGDTPVRENFFEDHLRDKIPSYVEDILNEDLDDRITTIRLRRRKDLPT